MALTVLVAVALAGCGNSDETGSTQTADRNRYCELSAQLEQSAEEHFAQLDRSASQEDFQQAHVEFIDENQAEIDELPEVAPEEIQGDIETVLAGMRAQAGEEVEVDEAEIDAADQRTRDFERDNC